MTFEKKYKILKPILNYIGNIIAGSDNDEIFNQRLN